MDHKVQVPLQALHFIRALIIFNINEVGTDHLDVVQLVILVVDRFLEQAAVDLVVCVAEPLQLNRVYLKQEGL